MADLAWFWWTLVLFAAREAWSALPGPWPVKAALLIFCTLGPIPGDEVVLFAIMAAWRSYKARKRTA